MHRILSLLVVAGFVATASLISMTDFAAAAENCPTGSTCKCVPTTFTKCKSDAQGHQYDCQQYKGEKCTVVSGPGSGKKAAVAGQGTATPTDKNKVGRPKNAAPSR